MTAPDPSRPEAPDEHPDATRALGAGHVTRIAVNAQVSAEANRRWWDADAVDYDREHGGFLGTSAEHGEFVWCPEGMHEGDWHLLGDVTGRRILEVGAGSAPCSRWLAAHGAHPVAFDVSHGMLALGAARMREHELAGAEPDAALPVPLVQADAQAVPFVDEAFDLACSAFGAVPFVADSAGVMAEVFRVLRPGGRWVFSTNHPMRWIFPDDPGEDGLVARFPYFDRSPTSRSTTPAPRSTSSITGRWATASARSSAPGSSSRTSSNRPGRSG